MSKVTSIFIGPDGLRHGWRFLIFVAAVVLVAQFLEQLAIAFLEAKLHVGRSGLSASALILGDGFDLIMVLVVTGVFALCERRRIDSYGLPIKEAFGGLFWNGVVAALVVVAFVAAGMLVTGGMRIDGIALRGIDLITSPLLWLVAMLFVGVTEEYFFRAGFWPRGIDHHSAVCRPPPGKAARKRNRYRNDFCSRPHHLHERSYYRITLVGGRLACRL
jgi:membrane protease YdiL (CAAX protease family)